MELSKELLKLKSAYEACQKCSELCSFRSQIVFGFGNSNADILLIGEAPGANEDLNGVPFCGASGKVLDELLSSIGVLREEVFITNTVICRPEKNRNPKIFEIKNCNDRLMQTIGLVNPKVIVSIGNFASKTLIGKDAKPGITKIRGKVFEVDVQGRKYPVVPVIHPANLLYNGRNPEVFKKMKDDFQKIIDVKKGLLKQN